MNVKTLPVAVLYALAEMRHGRAARAFRFAFNVRFGLHLVR